MKKHQLNPTFLTKERKLILEKLVHLRLPVFFLILFSISSTLITCSPDTLESNNYLQWVNNAQNGLITQVASNGLTYSLQYTPRESLVLQQGKNKSINTKDFHALLDEYGVVEYYTLRLKCNTPNTDLLKWKLTEHETTYEDRLNYFAFDFQNDIKMIVNQDTIECNLFHFENHFGVSPFLTFSLGFDPPKAPSLHREILVDNKIFEKEKIQLVIKQTAIDNIPKLKL